MKKTLIRAVSFLVTLSLLTGLLAPLAGAVEYEGVTSLSIDAKSALLIDMDTEQVLYEQAADEQRYPASITKIMTALLTLEAVGRGELDLNDVITMDDAALADLTPDSSTAGLQAGEEITVRNLLYCLLLASANEAANALAIAVAGDIPAFVEQMNQRAQELGMSGTHFVNPHGLHSDDHYTTARDIFKMAKQAMTHATFREIVSTGTYTVPATNLSGERTLYNTNALLTSALHPGYTYSGTIGIKTGSTGQAGYCLTAAVEMKGHTLISVVLGAENPTDSQGNVQRMQFSESVRLLDWASDNFSAATLLDSETYLQEIPVRFSADTSHVVLRPAQSVRALIPGTYDDTRLELRLRLNSEVASAPISAGDILGTVTVIYAGQEYGTIDMVAVSDVSFSPFMAFVTSVNTVLGNIFVRLLLLALVLLGIGFLRRYRERTKEERKARRQAKLEEKMAFRQREAEARQQDEALAQQEKAAREQKRKEELLLRQQQQQERQAQRAQEAQERQIKREQERLQREERHRQLQAERQARQKEREERLAQERAQRQREREERQRQLEQERAQRQRQMEQERRQREEARRRREEERRRQEAQERRRRQEAEARRRRQEQEERQRQERRRWEQADRERRRREEWERRARQAGQDPNDYRRPPSQNHNSQPRRPRDRR
ncbi:serine hydrolase [Evtepia sp.]|uniref:D-alanyl-D-alanine carboxypeptidase family protein n=1 Tax=Evtepia sp. TaxID=2773933 RepID=UPI00399A5812